MKLFIQKLLLGFASGVITAASIWSLLNPSIEMTGAQWQIEWMPASVGFLFGIIFLLILDSFMPHLHLDQKKQEGIKIKLRNSTMLVMSVTFHNIPKAQEVEHSNIGTIGVALGLVIMMILDIALG